MPTRVRVLALLLGLAGAVAPAAAQPAAPLAPLAPPPPPAVDTGAPAASASPPPTERAPVARLSILEAPIAAGDETPTERPRDVGATTDRRRGGDMPPDLPPARGSDKGDRLSRDPGVRPTRDAAERPVRDEWRSVSPASYLDSQDDEPPPPPARRAKLTAPADAVPLPATLVERGAGETRTRSTSSANPDPVNDFLSARRTRKQRERDLERRPPPDDGGGVVPASARADVDDFDAAREKDRHSWKFGEKFMDMMPDRERFRSNHAFDGFISPVTNPFLFEDPRSLTELRPIYIYQKVPSGQPFFQGGNVQFYGTQARLAITERLSFTVNKLGAIGLNPSGTSLFDGQFGFAELWLGPKYTLICDEDAGRLLALGAIFQLPVGDSAVYQNTGSLSIVPYATYGQNFFKTRLGSINGLLGGGYSFSVNNERSDYYYLSGHLDFDVADWHKIYPLIELNYQMATTNGTSSPLGFEGRDLVNFGGQAKGSNLLTGAIGARWKIRESIQLGGAFEIPLLGNRDLFDYRFTVDLIWRY